MPDLNCPAPDPRSIDDQFIMAVNILRAAGLHDAADWIQAVATEKAEKKIAEVSEPPVIVGSQSNGTPPNPAHGWIPPFEPPVVVPSEPSRSDAVKEAMALVEHHDKCGRGPTGICLFDAGLQCMEADDLRPVVAALADAEKRAKDAEDSKEELRRAWAQSDDAGIVEFKALTRKLATASEIAHALDGQTPCAAWADGACPCCRGIYPLVTRLLAVSDAPAGEANGCCDAPPNANAALREAYRLAHADGCHWPGNHLKRTPEQANAQAETDGPEAFVRALDAAQANAQGSEAAPCSRTNPCRGHESGTAEPHCKFGHSVSDWTDSKCPTCDAELPPPPPFTAEEARERADTHDSIAEMAHTVNESAGFANTHRREAATLRHYAAILERDDALERAAEEALKEHDRDKGGLAWTSAGMELLRSALAQRARGKA